MDKKNKNAEASIPVPPYRKYEITLANGEKEYIFSQYCSERGGDSGCLVFGIDDPRGETNEPLKNNTILVGVFKKEVWKFVKTVD